MNAFVFIEPSQIEVEAGGRHLNIPYLPSLWSSAPHSQDSIQNLMGYFFSKLKSAAPSELMWHSGPPRLFAACVWVPDSERKTSPSPNTAPAPGWEATWSEHLGNQTKVAGQPDGSLRACVSECVGVKTQRGQASAEWAAWGVQAVTWATPHWNLSSLIQDWIMKHVHKTGQIP